MQWKKQQKLLLSELQSGWQNLQKIAEEKVLLDWNFPAAAKDRYQMSDNEISKRTNQNLKQPKAKEKLMQKW